jgi:hypothetical protein
MTVEEGELLRFKQRLAECARHCDRIAHAARQWRELRELRNRLTHEYADQLGKDVAVLNELWDALPHLLAIEDHVRRFAESRAPR